MTKKSLLFTAITILAFATITMAQIPNYVPTNGLVGWWPFTGNANDLSGNGNNGTINGGVTLTTDRFNNLNRAYSFDGNADYINCGNTPSVNMTGSLTISAWLYASDLTDARGVVTKSPIGNSYALVVGAYNISNLNFLGINTGYLVPTFSWVHVVSVFDAASQTIRLYNNGVLYGTQSVPFNSIGTSSDNLCLGTHRPTFTPNWSWSGKLDDIGIWNRALNQQEIAYLYNSCQLSVSTQPINQSVNISNNAQFTTASSDPFATYQWQTDLGVGFQNLNNVGQYSGTANDTLTITNTTLSNNNQPFRCIMSSGSCSDTSTVAVLTVLCNISVITQPINQSVNISNNAQFTTASSDPLAAYQWQTDLGVGFQNLNNVGQYSGTINDTLTIANTTLSNNNQPFRCIISSGACTDTSALAVLTVINNVGINEISQSNLFSVYPNPAHSQINVKADATLLGSVYTVYDNTGKVVLSGKINSENTVIELGNLSGGIYLFSVGENMKQTFKVIKE